MGADGGPLGAEFFPAGEPGLRRLNAEETERAWRAFRAEAERQAKDGEKPCCRELAESVAARLAEMSEKKESTR